MSKVSLSKNFSIFQLSDTNTYSKKGNKCNRSHYQFIKIWKSRVEVPQNASGGNANQATATLNASLRYFMAQQL